MRLSPFSKKALYVALDLISIAVTVSVEILIGWFSSIGAGFETGDPKQ